MFANLYRECRKLGLTPRDVDGMEIWELAVTLGADLVDTLDPALRWTRDPSGMELLRMRMAHAQGRGPKPETGVMTEAEALAITQTLGQGSL